MTKSEVYTNSKRLLLKICMEINIDYQDIDVNDKTVMKMMGEPIWLDSYNDITFNSNIFGIDIFGNLDILSEEGKITSIDELATALAIDYDGDEIIDLLCLLDGFYDSDNKLIYKNLITTQENLYRYLINHNVSEEKAALICDNKNRRNCIDENMKNYLCHDCGIPEDIVTFLKKVEWLVPEKYMYEQVKLGLKLFWLKMNYHDVFVKHATKILKERIKLKKGQIICLEQDIEILESEEK